MGMDVRANVIYGFAIHGEGFDYEKPECPENVKEDWEKVYAEKRGVADPFIDDETYGRSPENKAACSQYWTAQREVLKTAKGEIEIEGDLCGGCTTSYVTHKNMNISCNWDGATEITPEQVTPKPEWREELQAFCEFMNIPWQEPKMMIICSAG